ncbi:MAG: hypothetical protein KDJ38_17240 [Gammaproteobacteria bacterium]|nr:hypothetical protein [Gammaproteobacteria bacterium]
MDKAIILASTAIMDDGDSRLLHDINAAMSRITEINAELVAIFVCPGFVDEAIRFCTEHKIQYCISNSPADLAANLSAAYVVQDRLHSVGTQLLFTAVNTAQKEIDPVGSAHEHLMRFDEINEKCESV